MDALVGPIERVVEATEWFVRTPDLRVMHVVTSGLLRNVILKHLTATELLEVNTCPFFVFEAPTEPGDDGWSLRGDELRADWEGLAESAPPGAGVAALWPEQQADTPFARFAVELGQALSRLRPPMTGLVIVLAPVWVRDARRWRQDLAALFALPGLDKARFVVLESDEPHAQPVCAALEPAVELVDARIDDEALRREAAAQLEAMKNAPAGATGPQLVGAAGPPVAPPPRKKQPPPLSPEQREELAQQVGVPAIMLDADAMRELRVLVLGAASAMTAKDPALAVRLQREARDFCVRHGLGREAVVNELVLAGYVLQSGRPERALDIFREGRQRAEQAGLPDMAVQAQMAVGSCLLVMKEVDEAAAAYAEAGELGGKSKAPVMAIEAFRMCGQLLVSKGAWNEGAAAFRRALETAEAAGAQVKKSSTAMEAARQLADVCREHGLTQQAESLEAQAAAMEAAILEQGSAAN